MQVRCAESLEAQYGELLRQHGNVSAYSLKKTLYSRAPPLDVSDGVLKEWILKYRPKCIQVSCAESLQTQYGEILRQQGNASSQCPVEYKLLLALAESGDMYTRPIDGACSNWSLVGTVGDGVQRIAVYGSQLLGVTCRLAVDIQDIAGVSAQRWTRHARGRVADITVHDGILYGAGLGQHGGPVYRWKGIDEGWQKASKGRCHAIATRRSIMYCLGNDDTVYQQPIDGLTTESKWTKAFEAPGIKCFEILDGGKVMGVRQGMLVSFDSAVPEQGWKLESTPCPLRSITVTENVQFARIEEQVPSTGDAGLEVARIEEQVPPARDAGLEAILLNNLYGLSSS